MTNKIRFLANFLVMLLTQASTLCMVNPPTKAAIDHHLKQLFVHYQLDKKVGTTYEKLNSIPSLEWCTCQHATRNSREILLTDIVHTITQQFKPTDKLVITSFGAGSLLFEFFLCKLLEHYNFRNIQLNYIEADAYKNDSAHQNFKNNLAHIDLKRINFSQRKTTPKSDIVIMIDPDPNLSDLEDFKDRHISNFQALSSIKHMNYFNLARINRCLDRRGNIIFLTPSYFLEQNLPLSFPLIFYKKNVPDHDRKKMIEDIIQAHKEFSGFKKNNIAYIDNMLFMDILETSDLGEPVPKNKYNSFFTPKYTDAHQKLTQLMLQYTSRYNHNKAGEVLCYLSMPMIFQELIEFSQQASGSYFFSLNNNQIQSGSTKKNKPFIAQFYEMQGWKPLGLIEPNQLTEKMTSLKTCLEALKFRLNELRKKLNKLKKKLISSHP